MENEGLQEGSGLEEEGVGSLVLRPNPAFHHIQHCTASDKKLSGAWE